ncbi:hypothetical protein MPDQ_007037 [Monascus purpureus]|uniref:Octanoyltransferase n=1 Tax=Monascus purpureus TaxID=5098 RepID=A0A507QXA9_MONPU|nr:hypothetical protein MPDQ_007037 [Monascus purpureus]BDD63371.1 hypothetical protein MAP00_008270 [Monascus purpureus]
MKLAHLHLPNITSFTRVSRLQETLTTHLLSHKRLAVATRAADAFSSAISPLTPPPDPTIVTFTPNPVYTTGRRDLPPSNTSPESSSPRHPESLSLPPSLEPIRSLLNPPHGSPVAEYHPTLRGGQTTYHGPGQMVAYTILDLRRLGLTPRCHIRLLEKSVVDVLRSFGIQGLITEDPGIWVKPIPEKTSLSSSASDIPKKITAVGVHLRRNISSYGIGFNVTEEPMWYFRQIVPCGLEGREATSLEALGVRGVSVDHVAGMFVDAFAERFNADFVGPGGRGQRIEKVYRIQEQDILDM